MSMHLLTILQFTGVSIVYAIVTLFLPWLFLRKHMARFSIPEQLMMYFLAGNFYIIYLVFLMQFLHISCRATLIAGTALPFVWRFIRRERGKISRYVEQVLLRIQYILRGELGIKSLFFQMGEHTIGKWYARKGKRKKFIQYLPDILLTAAVIAGVLYVYGKAMFNTYGYKASDIPVHNYWINMLCKNDVFCAGVYPYGFHCMIYYMHEVFAIKTYVLLRVFALVQTIFIHLAVLVVLRALCKSRYMPYFGIGCYLMLNIFRGHTYTRYLSTLPQEYGMLFIFPAAYFAIRFFWDYAAQLKEEKQKNPTEKRKKRKEKKKREKQKPSVKGILYWIGCRLIGFWNKIKSINPYLLWYAISFSLTLTVHFYNTMVIGVFCVAIAFGFFFRFLRWKYFRRIVTAALLGILISVIPMAIGVAMGKGLQGSLYWGMNVISGKTDDDDSTQKTVIKDKDGNEVTIVGTVDEETIKKIQDGTIQFGTTPDGGSAATDGTTPDGGSATTDGTTSDGGSTPTDGMSDQAAETGQTQISTKEKINEKIAAYKEILKEKGMIIYGQIKTYVFSENEYQSLELKALIVGIAALFVFGLISILCRRVDYGGMLWSVGWYGVFMCVMQAMHALGLPQLMDPSRNSIFFAYSVGFIWALDLDAVLYLIFGWFKRPIIMNICSLAVLVYAGNQAVQYDMIKTPLETNALEKNEAITCLSNILRDEKDHTWTILSANDELRMIEEYGYHYEMITFLRELQDLNKHHDITIPTPDVYFFIEKKPVNYASTANALAGTSVSLEYAQMPVSNATGIFCYQQEQRWITMSHMYYWAQAFKKLYPNEMQVYYETDEFVCYKLHQNSYSLYNLAIDYGYNDPQLTDGQE